MQAHYFVNWGARPIRQLTGDMAVLKGSEDSGLAFKLLACKTAELVNN